MPSATAPTAAQPQPQPQPTADNVPNPQPAASNAPPCPLLPIEGPRVVNIVCGVNLNCLIDLRGVALLIRNAEFNPRRFQAVILRQVEPRSSTLVFASGKMQVLGARSVADARLAARRFARMIQELGFRVRMTGFNVQNLVAHANVKFTVRLEGLLASQHARYASYEPEIFPGLIYRTMKPKISLLIFTTGKLVMLGAKREEDFDEAIALLYPVLQQHRLWKVSDARDDPR